MQMRMRMRLRMQQTVQNSLHFELGKQSGRRSQQKPFERVQQTRRSACQTGDEIKHFKVWPHLHFDPLLHQVHPKKPSKNVAEMKYQTQKNCIRK